MKHLDMIIVGAGPAGLSCAIEAQRAGLSCVVLEKGSIVNSIRQFQHTMSFFSTPELLEIGDIPFVVPATRPTTIDCVNYYRRVATHYDLPVRYFDRVESIVRDDAGFAVRASRGVIHRSRSVVIATGYYDWPNRLGVPGEDLHHVRHYYREPFMYYKQEVLIVGGKNSAVEAALDLYRHGANVTLVHRRAGLSDGVKYWILPDFENRVRDGSITTMYGSTVEAFNPGETIVRDEAHRRVSIETGFAFVLIGYAPDTTMLSSYGIRIDEETRGPVFDPTTMETNVPDLYVAGGLAGGKITNRIFIENGREHGKMIVSNIRSRS